MSKFKFRTIDKHIESLQLNKIENVGFFENVDLLSTRQKIDKHYQKLEIIEKNKTKSAVKIEASQKIKLDEIKSIYYDIFNTKKLPGKGTKNEIIDAIVNFYKKQYNPADKATITINYQHDESDESLHNHEESDESDYDSDRDITRD